MKFLITSINSTGFHKGPTFKELANITAPSIIDYCSLHNYDYKIFQENPLSDKEISWVKLFSAKENIQNYDWVWCIDCDLMIMNHTIKLEHIVDNNYDVMMTTSLDGNIDYLNTGSILYKNSKWTQKFLEDIYNDGEFDNKGYWEQSAIIKYWKNHPEERSHFKFVNKRLINSHYHYWWTKTDENYQHGDFAVHLCGMDNDFRYETLKNLQPYIIKPIKNIQQIVKIWDR